jgi:dienelactone hydrolase
MRLAFHIARLAMVLCAFAGQVYAEEVLATLSVNTRDAYGGPVQAEMPVTVFRPFGPGPFSAVVLSHGRPPSAKRQSMGRVKLSSVTATLLGMGLVVVVPTRIGYGIAAGPDPEFTVSCEQPRYAEALSAVADQIAAAVAYTRGLPYVDPERIYLVGHSVGGAGTVAAVVRDLPGVRAAVAFNSGHGARPQSDPGEPCVPQALQSTFAQYGSVHSAVPVLWIQTEGDRSFSIANARSWFGAFVASGGEGAFRAFPEFREDSHDWFAQQPAQWRETVHVFFAAHGLPP